MASIDSEIDIIIDSLYKLKDNIKNNYTKIDNKSRVITVPSHATNIQTKYNVGRFTVTDIDTKVGGKRRNTRRKTNKLRRTRRKY